MAKSQPVEPAPIKVYRQCSCGATFFQGPFPRGEIINDVFVEIEKLYQCVNCNKIQSIDQMVRREIQPVVL